MINFINTLKDQLAIRIKYGAEFIGDPEKIKVGLSPRTLMYTEGSKKLYLYKGVLENSKPLLLVYSLINRPYIFDLRPKRSMIEFLVNNGFDVYLLDWGDPQPEDAYENLSDLINGTLNRAVSFILKKYNQTSLNMLGYCMGGTFASLYTSIYPEKINKLTLLTTPLSRAEGGLLQKIGEKLDIGKAISSTGLISGRELKMFFNSVKPAGIIKKERDFWLNNQEEKFLDHFLPVEKWSNDTPNVPAKVFSDFIDICFNHDLSKESVNVGNKIADFKNIKCEVFSIAAEHDWIIDKSAVSTVKEVMPNAKNQTYLLAGGHIGLVIGRPALEIWNKIKDFNQN